MNGMPSSNDHIMCDLLCQGLEVPVGATAMTRKTRKLHVPRAGRLKSNHRYRMNLGRWKLGTKESQAAVDHRGSPHRPLLDGYEIGMEGSQVVA